jgi:hypothetical protein
VFFPRTGKFQSSLGAPCPIEFELFDVGTKHFLLSGDRRKDLVKYFREHPISCNQRNPANQLSH